MALLIKTPELDQMAVEAQRRKDNAPGRTEQTWWSLTRLVGGRRTPPIHLVTAELPGRRALAVHARGDCAVGVTRAEGFGLVPFQAGAYGNPSIVTGFGAHLSCSPRTTPSWWTTRSRRPVRRSPTAGFQLADDQRWARPDFDHLGRLMRRVADDRPWSRTSGPRCGTGSAPPTATTASPPTAAPR